MDRLQLRLPAPEMAEELLAYRRELDLTHDRDRYAGCAGIQRFDTIGEWLSQLALLADPDTCPEGKVPSVLYAAVREEDGRIVGLIDLRRHIRHPILGTWGGHIGYNVRPSERGKGYAPVMLQAVLSVYAAWGIPEVLVTCNSDNTPSERTILHCGGRPDGEVTANGEIIRRYLVPTDRQCR